MQTSVFLVANGRVKERVWEAVRNRSSFQLFYIPASASIAQVAYTSTLTKYSF